jgi:hypothetical protein
MITEPGIPLRRGPFPAPLAVRDPSNVAQPVHLEHGAPGSDTAQDRLGNDGG